jgi:hypothetical protein
MLTKAFLLRIKMRKAIGKKARFEVFKRDGFICAYCGSSPPLVILQVDHIHPVSKGGTNSLDNLITSCQPCNIGKGANNLSSIPQSLDEKAKMVAEQERQIKGYQEVIFSKEKRIDNETNQIVDIFLETGSFYKSDVIEIKKFIKRIGFYQVKESAELAVSKFFYPTPRAFKYFCGICINKIKESQK